ncbi:hypothetical protein P170DRAFT_430758 [Aspergillus steynii IBT 23096]|uniref:Luciferase domain-containing protein n=1 Tax=Aspergillus steynii IBT 23096 TaxID=1392250 RepID=A0A2I2FT11_9EURO|nr:uncharacterized protein P170DRAFT_430758 [Aspergillus steynii IBT 23096]PLB43727.1 hypothetical protein P170DRAFT_430758 [Aspergillus steynii IBT 23096]
MDTPYSPPANVPIHPNAPPSPPLPTSKPSHLLSLHLLLLILPPTLFLLHAIRKDYHAFLALGPGGTPSTPTGYLRICILRLLALRNPFSPPSIPDSLSPQTGYFHRFSPLSPSPSSSAAGNPTKDTARILPHRRGPRPLVTGIAPQRQLTQRSTQAIYETLTQEIHALVHAHPEKYYTGTSCFEKHSTGIFALPSSPSSKPQPQDQNQPHPTGKRSRVTCNGEICHSHPIDGSLHLTLHPADVRVLVERGWGQRHPLAWEEDGWARRWLCGRRFVPAGFVMVYAPRDEREVQVVMEVVRAAGWWVCGED